MIKSNIQTQQPMNAMQAPCMEDTLRLILWPVMHPDGHIQIMLWPVFDQNIESKDNNIPTRGVLNDFDYDANYDVQGCTKLTGHR